MPILCNTKFTARESTARIGFALPRHARRDRTAFIVQRIALPKRLINDAWWLLSPAQSAVSSDHHSDSTSTEGTHAS
jgi:hypothetical protein